MLNLDIKINSNNENNLFASKTNNKSQNDEFSKVFEDTTKSYEKSQEQINKNEEKNSFDEETNEEGKNKKAENTNTFIQKIQELLVIKQPALTENQSNQDIPNEKTSKEIQLLNNLLTNSKKISETSKNLKNGAILRENSEKILQQREQSLELTAKMMSDLKASNEKLVTIKNPEMNSTKLFTQDKFLNLENLNSIKPTIQNQSTTLSTIADELKAEITEIKVSISDDKSSSKNYDFNNSSFNNLNAHVTKLSLNKNVSFAKTLHNTQMQEQNVLNQVKDATLKTPVKTGTSSVNIILKPESLGRVNINLISNNGVVTAQFTAETRQTADILNKNIEILKQNLTEQGVKIAEISVKVQETYNAENFADNKNLENNNFENLKENLSQKNSNKMNYQEQIEKSENIDFSENNEQISENEIENINSNTKKTNNKELEIYNNMGRKV